jgi:AcrR family transcriptional regulator
MNERLLSAGRGAGRMQPQGETRQRILAAALTLFLKQGYHGTSMRQIARQVDITPAAIYNHFPAKEALFIELLSKHIPHRALVNALSSAQGGTSEELLRDALRRMQSAMADQADNIRLVLIELLEFQGSHVPSLADELLPGALHFVRKLQDTEGGIRPYPPRVIVRAVGGLFLSHAIWTGFFSQVAGLQERPGDFQALCDLLLHGLLAPRAHQDSAEPATERA